jgi:hypothetical protein
VAERPRHEAPHAAPPCPGRRAALTAENELLERAERVFNVPKPAPVKLALWQMHSRNEPQRFNLTHDECGDRRRAEADERLDWSRGCVETPNSSKAPHIWRSSSRVPRAEDIAANAMECARWPDASGAQARTTRCLERCRSPSVAQAMPLLCLFTPDGEHDSRASYWWWRSRTLARTHRPPNGSHAKLCGQGPRAEA